MKEKEGSLKLKVTTKNSCIQFPCLPSSSGGTVLYPAAGEECWNKEGRAVTCVNQPQLRSLDSLHGREGRPCSLVVSKRHVTNLDYKGKIEQPDAVHTDACICSHWWMNLSPLMNKINSQLCLRTLAESALLLCTELEYSRPGLLKQTAWISTGGTEPVLFCPYSMYWTAELLPGNQHWWGACEIVAWIYAAEGWTDVYLVSQEGRTRTNNWTL